jgi:ABC-type oligopeptide transport system substrate-binding subunit/DNA-binding SARP family transcriptional activator
MTRLILRFLGPPYLEVDNQAVELDRRKAVALLAYLAVTGQPHPRDSLAALLWPDYDQSKARAALRRTLSTLNRTLPDRWLEADRDMIGLEPGQAVWLDVDEFRRLLAVRRQHAHANTVVCPDCLPALTRAIDLYRADFLAGFTLRDSPGFDEWQFFQAETLRQELAQGLALLVAGLTETGQQESAISRARQWLTLDSLNEAAHRALMQLYAITGRRNAALRQYQECSRILEEELGVPPAPETERLFEQIRAGEAGSPAPPNLPGAPATSTPAVPLFLTEPPPLPLSRPFVAREHELAQLRRCLDEALAGKGHVVFIRGNAGTGKTALVSEFARLAQESAANLLAMAGSCNAYTGLGDPYLPFREMLELLTGEVETHWRRGTVSGPNAHRLWQFLPTAGQLLVEHAPELINSFVPADRLIWRLEQVSSAAPWLDHLKQTVQRQAANPGQPSQPHLFEQFAGLMEAVSQKTPLLLLVDDAQWADNASIDLLFHLGRRLTGSRVLLVVTYRPDEVALGRGGSRHPLEPVVNELKRTFGELEIDLSHLPGRNFVDALLDAEPNRLPESFRAALHHQTQGHPLFTVELLRAMQERGDVCCSPDGVWIEGDRLNWNALPVRVEAVIAERLDRLDPDLRQLLTVASVEGETFTAQVLARVQAAPERRLVQALSQELGRRHHLVQPLPEFRLNSRFLSQYTFTHTLFQQYLYHALSPGERRLLHGEVALALEEIYAGHLENVTVSLARHFSEAGEAGKAIDYLLQAGDRARGLYAHREAVNFYRRALALLKQQGQLDRAARTLMKLGLTHHLDLNFAQARQAYAEGTALWQQAGAGQTDLLTPAPHPLRLVGSEPATLDPTLASEGASGRIIDQLFCGLLEQTPELEIVPNLAHSWEMLEGGCRYVFSLRTDAHWSDGAPVTAADFVFAWRRMVNPATGSPVANLLYDIKGARAFHQGRLTDAEQIGVEALNTHTLQVDLEGPTGYFLQLLAHTSTFPVPRHRVEAHGEGWTKPENLVTNGPFLLHRWVPTEMMILTRNPVYRGQAAGNVDRVELSFRHNPDDELALYQADQLDASALWFLSGPEIDRIRQRYADDYFSGPAVNTQYVGFDVRREPFNDVWVRRAFAMAIDKETLAHVVLGGYAFPATGGFIPPEVPGHSPGIGLPFNPAEARRLLAQAGYPNGQNFPVVDWPVIPGVGPVVNYLQAQWQTNLGIKLRPINMDSARFFDLVDKNPPHLYRIGWKADYPDPDNFLRTGTFCHQTGWQNADYDALVEQARRETGLEARLKLYHQADRLLIEEAALVPFLYLRRHQLVKPWVRRYPTSAIKSAFWKDVVIDPH